MHGTALALKTAAEDFQRSICRNQDAVKAVNVIPVVRRVVIVFVERSRVVEFLGVATDLNLDSE